MEYRPQTVDDGSFHRPRSIVHRLAVTVYLLIFSLAACQPKASSVSLALLGDLMVGRGVYAEPDSLAYLVPDLSAADLALANLESPLALSLPAIDSTYNLCASSVRADLLHDWSFDLLSLTNNHSFDCGPDGPAQTRSILEAVGIMSIGPGMKPIYREVNGVHLAFLAFDDISSLLDEKTAVQVIRSARLTGALVVVSIHWGAEYQGGASDRQKSLAQEFAQAGAALIWGHHPHVLQPAEWISTQPREGLKPSQGRTLVLYSLGNALFDQGGLDDTCQSALVVVTLDADGVTSVRTIPFKTDIINSRVMQPDAGAEEKIRDRLNHP
jgi:poly-gamma-glutamate synthesis protein (capsule biosynthesis protein)